jgi:hypothetical protein
MSLHSMFYGDRAIPTKPVDRADVEALRLLLKRSHVPDIFDAAIQERVGKLIAQAVLNRTTAKIATPEPSREASILAKGTTLIRKMGTRIAMTR